MKTNPWPLMAKLRLQSRDEEERGKIKVTEGKRRKPTQNTLQEVKIL